MSIDLDGCAVRCSSGIGDPAEDRSIIVVVGSMVFVVDCSTVTASPSSLWFDVVIGWLCG